MSKYIRAVLDQGARASGVKFKTAIVVQGPYSVYTRIVTRELTVRFPNTLIILSTPHLPSDEESRELPIGSFLSLAERTEISEGGRLVLISVKPPSKEEDPLFWSPNREEENLQRLSSYAGLYYAQELGIEYSLNVRSDTFLGSKGILDRFCSLLADCPLNPRSGFSPGMKGRIIVSGANTNTREPPGNYSINDHWHFGFTVDVLRLFDITERSCWSTRNIEKTTPGNRLTVTWMKDMGIEACCNTELLGRYFIVMDPEEVEQVWLRYINLMRYLREGSEYIRQVFLRYLPEICTRHEKWLEFKKEYE